MTRPRGLGTAACCGVPIPCWVASSVQVPTRSRTDSADCCAVERAVLSSNRPATSAERCLMAAYPSTLLLLAALAAAANAGESGPRGTLWTFADSHSRLAASSGTATLIYFDPDGTGWGPAQTAFGLASRFGLPPMTGGDPNVMRVPPLT